MSGPARAVRQVGLGQAAVGFTINSLGACLVLLARDLDTPPAQLVWLSSSFGVGLLAVGLAGGIVLRRGPQPVLPVTALVAAAGATLLATAPVALAAAAGALLLGIGAAGIVLVAPALLRGPDAAARLSRVNAIASVSGLFGPLALGALDGAGASGRLALLLAVPPLLVLALGARRPAEADVPVPGPGRPSRRRVAGAWATVVTAVSIEFCFTIWATARLQETGLPTGAAAAAVTAFLVGMAAGRFAAPRLIARGVPVMRVGCALTVAGTLLVALTGAPEPVVTGLVIAGLGVAPLYPVTLARLVHVPGLPSTRAAAYGALASGTAILVAPVVLAALGAALDLRAAYLIAVLPLAAALAVVSRRERVPCPTP